MTRGRDGFTIIEVLVAVMLLTVGASALVGTSALVTRRVGRSRMMTIAVEVGNQRLETLRRSAAIHVTNPGPPCASPSFASSAAPDTGAGSDRVVDRHRHRERENRDPDAHLQDAARRILVHPRHRDRVLPMNNRRGFTMAELMIAMVLLLIVGDIAYQLLTRTQRVSQAQSERTGMQSNLRVGIAVLPTELRELGYDSPLRTNPDVVGMAADSIAIRAIRGSGIICNAAANQLVVDTSWHYSASRRPVATRDGLMIFLERQADLSTDDRWVRRPLVGVAAGICAASYGSRPGLALTTSLSAAGVIDGVVLGSPVQVYEVMVYKHMRSTAKTGLVSIPRPTRRASASSRSWVHSPRTASVSPIWTRSARSPPSRTTSAASVSHWSQGAAGLSPPAATAPRSRSPIAW